MLEPSIFYRLIQGGASFVDLFFLLAIRVILSYLFPAALWESANLLALLYVMFSCVFGTFPNGVLYQVLVFYCIDS